jgi:hypothetical protein
LVQRVTSSALSSLASWYYLQGEGQKKNELNPRSREKNMATERDTEVTRRGSCKTHHSLWEGKRKIPVLEGFRTVPAGLSGKGRVERRQSALK